MKKKGFILLEIVVAIFLIGLATVSFLPILSHNHKAITRVEIQGEMDYLGEYIFQRFYAKDDYILEILSGFENELLTVIEFIDIDEEYINKYICKVINMEIEEYLWNLKITVEPRNLKGEIPYVEFYGTIPKE